MALQPDGKVLIGATFVSADDSLTNRLTGCSARMCELRALNSPVPVSLPGNRWRAADLVMRRGESRRVHGRIQHGRRHRDFGPRFHASKRPLRFGPLEVEKTISIPILEDRILEDDETLEANLRNPGAAPASARPRSSPFASLTPEAWKPGLAFA